MKIGTDGVLLGAWLEVDNEPNRILDIGTGTGLIALMSAQRFPNTLIDAIEIDINAHKQCSENFSQSPWSDRLHSIHGSFQDFYLATNFKYDLIVSNPPFFANGQQSINKKRNQARFENALPFDILLKGSSLLLSENGIFALIIPKDQEKQILILAELYNLSPSKITYVKGNINAPIKRCLIELRSKNILKKETQKSSELILEKERHVYTDEFMAMARDFYLNM